MTQIEFKDLNPSLSAESFLEELTDEAVNIIGGTHGGSYSLFSGLSAAMANAKDYITSIETTIGNISATNSSGINAASSYIITGHNSADGYVFFCSYSTHDV